MVCRLSKSVLYAGNDIVGQIAKENNVSGQKVWKMSFTIPRGGAGSSDWPSGARVLVTLLGAMKERNAKIGIASLCIGGGEAVAMAVSRGE